MRGGVGVPLMKTKNPDWIYKRQATILYQNALIKHPLLQDVPTLPELATSPEGAVILKAIAGTAEIGRSVIAPPGIPPERLDVLRKAFDAMVADPEFLAAAEAANMEIAPAKGQDVDVIMHEMARLPKETLQKIDDLLHPK